MRTRPKAQDHAAGSVNRKMEHRPGSDSTQIFPPYPSTIRQIASPIPVPAYLCPAQSLKNAEHLFCILRRYTDSIVLDRQLPKITFPLSPNLNKRVASFIPVFNGISN